ncbi:hypothetical protein LEMLEM_LOCUS16992, partial [Lemmus lemmus]
YTAPLGLSTGGPGSPGQSQGRPYLHRHRSPPVHHPERRLDRGDSERQGQGAGHAPAAAGTERRLFLNGPYSGWCTELMNSCYSVIFKIFKINSKTFYTLRRVKEVFH